MKNNIINFPREHQNINTMKDIGLKMAITAELIKEEKFYDVVFSSKEVEALIKSIKCCTLISETMLSKIKANRTDYREEHDLFYGNLLDWQTAMYIREFHRGYNAESEEEQEDRFTEDELQKEFEEELTDPEIREIIESEHKKQINKYLRQFNVIKDKLEANYNKNSTHDVTVNLQYKDIPTIIGVIQMSSKANMSKYDIGLIFNTKELEILDNLSNRLLKLCNALVEVFKLEGNIELN